MHGVSRQCQELVHPVSYLFDVVSDAQYPDFYVHLLFTTQSATRVGLIELDVPERWLNIDASLLT